MPSCRRLFLAFVPFLVSAALVEAAPARVKWITLEKGQTVELIQSLELGQARVEQGTVYRVEEVTALDMIRVTEIVLRAPICSSPEGVSEMEIILPERAPPGVEVGVELRHGCVLAIYIQTQDLEAASFFRPQE